ncbi:MAG TPA: tetratricopeptide repeat protein [Tepidisphaeraceae bacterium]
MIWTAASLKNALARGVSYAGQLADLSHDDFVEVVESRGGRYVRYSNHGRFAVLVVGEAGLPILPSGELLSLPDAQLISEREFARLLKVDIPSGGDHLYTAKTLSELLHVPESRINAWVKAGLIAPIQLQHGVMRFRFSQVAVARTLCELAANGVTMPKLRRTLQMLQRRMPDLKEPLQQLTMLERNGPMLVRLESGELAEVGGQLQMEFEDHAPPQAVQLRLVPAITTPADWHEQGVEQERAGLLAEAEEAYRRALSLGGPNAQIVFDLASVLVKLGRPQQAIERYRQVVEMEPRRTDAWNNLGILLSGLGDDAAACDAFRQGLRVDPEDPKLHYNLADSLDALGIRVEARAHWQTYLRYDPHGSPQAEHAASRLRSPA